MTDRLENMVLHQHIQDLRRERDELRRRCDEYHIEQQIREARAQMAAQTAPPASTSAVGVVGAVEYRVRYKGGAVGDVVHASAENANHWIARYADSIKPEAVAIVPVDRMVPLTSAEPVRWVDYHRNTWELRSTAAIESAMVSPLYEGLAEPSEPGA